RIWFLVSGESKRSVIDHLFRVEAADLPADHIYPSVERLWWLSEELYAVATTYAKALRVFQDL
ncbi:MAG: hypothetical protein ACK4UU_03235, partial [Fimbriimonadales bacterium]